MKIIRYLLLVCTIGTFYIDAAAPHSNPDEERVASYRYASSSSAYSSHTDMTGQSADPTDGVTDAMGHLSVQVVYPGQAYLKSQQEEDEFSDPDDDETRDRLLRVVLQVIEENRTLLKNLDRKVDGLSQQVAEISGVLYPSPPVFSSAADRSAAVAQYLENCIAQNFPAAIPVSISADTMVAVVPGSVGVTLFCEHTGHRYESSNSSPSACPAFRLARPRNAADSRSNFGAAPGSTSGSTSTRSGASRSDYGTGETRASAETD